MDERTTPAPHATRRRPALRAWALPASLVVLLACAGSASAADQTVTAQPSINFSPQTVTINSGDTVTWNNAGGLHNVVFADGLFTMPAAPMTTPWMVQRTFTTPGNFAYICGNPDHDGMTGTVTVTAAPPPPGGTPPPGGSPGPGDPGQPKTELKLRLKLSDATPAKGKRVRFFGSVRPAIEGRVLIQRRGRKGSYKTVAKARLEEGTTSSTYSRRLRAVPGVYRARILASAAHEGATSSTRRVKSS
jgi:plastocyanin